MSSRFQIFLSLSIVLVLILLIYHPVIRFNFVQHDDENFIVYSPYLSKPFSSESMEWMMTAGLTQPAQPYVDYWQPVTTMSRMVDTKLFGMNPAGHHAMNVIYHAINTLLVFWLIMVLFEKLSVAIFVSFLFACHPLQVEPVVWVTARKDLLGGLFSLLCFISYGYFLRLRREGKSIASLKVFYLASLFFYIVSLMPKPSNVTLPFLFLILDDYFKSQQLTLKDWANRVSEKLPFMVVACSTILIPWISLRIAMTYYPPLHMVEVFGVHVLKYLYKILVPVQLGLYPSVFVYEFTHFQYAAFLISILLAASVIGMFRERMRVFYLGFYWYLIMIALPAMVNTPADRFTYFSKIGVFLCLSSPLFKTSKNLYDRWFINISFTTIILLLSVISYRQVWVWKSTDSLFENALKIDERNQLVQNDYGHMLFQKGKSQEALRHYLISRQLSSQRLEKVSKAMKSHLGE